MKPTLLLALSSTLLTLAGGVVRADEPSPFVAGGAAATGQAAPDGTSFELRGIMSTPEGIRYCIFDPTKKTSVWVGLNEGGYPFSILSADANNDSVDLKASDGRKLALTLRKAKVVALGAAPMPPPMMQPQGNFPQGQNNLSQPITAPVVLKPTPEDEQRRLQAIADEVRRRRLLREQQQNGMPPPPPPSPSG